jgi:hypothetical protein
VAKPTITYVPRADATSEAEVVVLGAIYKFVLDCHAKKEPAPEGRPDDAKERSKDDSSATQIIPKPS